MTRVLIAAPSAVVRAGLETVLEAESDLEVVGSAAGIDGLAHAMEADVVLVDLDRGLGGVPAVRALAADPPLPLVVLTGDNLSAAEALRQGARAVLPREAEAAEIVAAVRAASSGLVAVHPSAIESLLPHLPASSADEPHGEELTPREIEVLTMLAEGAGNKQIARRLGISEHTVKFHVGSILGKLNAASRTEAVTTGIRQGLILV